jgi:hypothetical protein
MADENQSAEVKEAGAKAPRDMTAVAMRDVRRARKLASDAKGTGSIPPEATLLLEIAGALALLDLAAAIREHKAA